jgi:cytochrome P450
MSLAELSDATQPLAAPIPPPKPLSLLQYARIVRSNFIAGFHSEVYEREIVELKLIGPRIFVVNDPAAIRHVLLTHVTNFPKAPIERRILGPGLGNGLVLSEGATWRAHRKIMAPCFDQAELRRYTAIMVDAAEQMMARWAVSGDGAALEICDAMMTLTLNIISRTMFSSGTDHIASIVRDASAKYQEAMMFGLPDFVPGLSAVWGFYKAARAKRILNPFNDEIHNLISSRTHVRDNRVHDDLLQRLIDARDVETNVIMSASEVRDQVFTLFIAGHETTALALTWTWYLLSLHPTIETKLHAELDATLGERSPRYEDLPQLTYTRMVVEEAMRLYPPAHSLAWRHALQDDEICNTSIPKGSVVAIAPWVVHRHHALWKSPERFDPERFAPAESARRDRLCYLPFGFGPRVCLGATFAMTEAVLTLAAIAKRYSLRLAPGQQVEPQALFTLRPRSGIRMIPRRRQH